MRKRIDEISEEERRILLSKSAFNLPARPSASGKSADEIKRAFYSAYLDRMHSLFSEINRIVQEMNEIVASFEGEGEGARIFGDLKNNRAMGKNAVAMGTGTVADGEGMLAAGRYNSPAGEDTLFSLGCGVDDNTRENALWVEMVDGEPRVYLKGGEYLSPELLAFLADLSAGTFSMGENDFEAASIYAREYIESDGDVIAKDVKARERMEADTVEGRRSVRSALVEGKTVFAEKTVYAKEVEAEEKVSAKSSVSAPNVYAERIVLGGEGESIPVTMETKERGGRRLIPVDSRDVLICHGTEEIPMAELVELILSQRKIKKRRNK